MRRKSFLLTFLLIAGYFTSASYSWEPRHHRRKPPRSDHPCGPALQSQAPKENPVWASLNHRLATNPNCKRLQLPTPFVSELAQCFRENKMWVEVENLETLLKVILNKHGLQQISANRSDLVAFAKALQKWRSEDLPLLLAPDNRGVVPKAQSNLSRFNGKFNRDLIIDDTYRLEEGWLKRGEQKIGEYDTVLAYIPIELINRTQYTISLQMRDLAGKVIDVEQVTARMRKEGFFHPEGAPDVVPVRVGSTLRFATVAHRRIVAARTAGLKKIVAVVHRPELALPSISVSNSFKLKMNAKTIEYMDPASGKIKSAQPGDTPHTWGEAIIFLSRNSRAVHGLTEEEFPDTGMPGLPRLPTRTR